MSDVRVLGLTSRQESPAGRFRIRQYRDVLAEHGVVLDESFPPPAKSSVPRVARRPRLALRMVRRAAQRLPEIAKASRYDVVWLSRELVQGLPTLEHLIRPPMVVDVDDAVWLARPLGKQVSLRNARLASAVLAGNNFIADWYRPHTPEVLVVPTSVDLDRFEVRSKPWKAGEPFVVGWTGTTSTLPYLESIEDQLAALLEKVPDAQLLVIGNGPPRFRTIAPDRVEFVRWTPENEAPSVARMTVGVMPLVDDEWARGKCAAKMIQYMACGVVPVVSPVGANIDVLEHEGVGFGVSGSTGFLDALLELYESPEQVEEIAVRAREVAAAHYSVQAHGPRLAELFKRLARRG